MPESDAFDLRWIGLSTGHAERLQVVVLAVGFAPVEVTDPEELVETLSGRRRFVQQIVSRYGGSVGRIDPNLQIVAWGWPVAGEADTRFAVAAALEIAADPALRPRCGVDAGIAITEEAENGFFDLGFVGEMVGAAVEFLATASAGEVRVSDAIGRLVCDAFSLAPCGGGQSRSPLWLVERRETRHRGRRSSFGRHRETIGREGEKEQIKTLMAAAKWGCAQLFHFEGEAGVGKTALMQRYVENTFSQTIQTIGVSFVFYHLPLLLLFHLLFCM